MYGLEAIRYLPPPLDALDRIVRVLGGG